MTVEISLTKGYVAIVDEADSAKVKPYKWRANKNRRSVYAMTTITTANGREALYMHRLIQLGVTKTDTVVDHINGNGLDNRRANLRECTTADNARNKKAPLKNNTSGFTGVSWHAQKGKWAASIVLANKKVHLGLFHDKEAAVLARKEAECQHYGVFAPA